MNYSYEELLPRSAIFQGVILLGQAAECRLTLAEVLFNPLIICGFAFNP